MKFVIIYFFISFIMTGQSNSETISGQKPKNFIEDGVRKSLIEALKTGTMTVETQKTLDQLGESIVSGSILDEKNTEKFKVLGQAIVEKTLNEKAKKLLGELLENDGDESVCQKLLDTLKENATAVSTQRNLSEMQGDEPALSSHSSSGQPRQELTFVVDDALERLNQVLKSDGNFSKENKDKIMNLIGEVLGYEKLLNEEHRETFKLLGKTLFFKKFVHDKYPKTLKLLGDVIVSNQISKKRNNETLKYLSKVFITKKPQDDEAFRQFAKMLVKNETSGKSKPVGQAPRKEVSENAQKLLNDQPVMENSSVSGNTEKQISSAKTSRNDDTPNNDSQGKPDSLIADQNVKQKTVKTKKSDKPKRSKRSSKAESKLTKESRQSDGKPKKSSKKSNQRSSSADKLKKAKKSSKKTKKSKRNTEDDDKPKSKNKLKKKREKSNKN